MREYGLYIDNEFIDASDKQTFSGINPFNQATIASFARGGAADVEKAVATARNAFDNGPWPRMSREERSGYLKAISDKINENKKLLTELEVLDSGSTIRKAGEDIYLSARNLASFAKLGLTDLDGELEGVSKPGFSKNLLLREPIGVVAAIIPWNFPLKMAIWKLGPALAAGNTVVLKPSEETPVTVMELMRLIQDVGIPKGVINVVTGYGSEAGAALASHPMVDKIAFTGSTRTGQAVMRAAATNLKKVTLECGGKSANIILDDADVEMAIDGAIYAIFYHAGQCCEAGTRLLLPNSIADEFVAKLVAKTKRIQLGDPMLPTTLMGPLVSKKQFDTVMGYIEKGKAEGATLLTGGNKPAVPECEKGFFIEPTIFDHVNNKSVIAQEEIFGPILSIIRYKTIDEAVQLANDSIYGLAGGVWSKDAEKAMSVARRLRAGTVWINEWHLLNERAPFGGYKQSGIGREFGIDGMKEYMESKHIYIDEVGVREKKTWYDTAVPKT
ncbi:MAG: aldehyde dehydrogenase family protein [Bacteroidetes bacterium]|nr:aldehyde dehydrogenase family protein [Bacteroidota bacterium]MCW5895024.1 aldehyde dehydrogenase family protein [Bacteroidota bacterium]